MRSCSIDDCPNPCRAKGYCNPHYLKARKYGDPLADRRRPKTACDIDGCGKKVHGHRMCTMHYLRWYNHGDPRRERQMVESCRVRGCNNPTRSQSLDLCEMHYCRLRRNGNLELRDMRRADAKYRAAHARISRDRGSASNYPCTDCGTQAQHWSYMHDDPNELVSDTGQPYSLSPTHYAPRCAPCHAIFDGTGANQYTR